MGGGCCFFLGRIVYFDIIRLDSLVELFYEIKFCIFECFVVDSMVKFIF